ncbi:MAG: class I SAM-dependent methyltransferase [Terriglobia bacterium]|jgi:SAM-dependent methyltransferase
MYGPSAKTYTDGSYLRKNPTWHAEDASYKAKDIITLLARNGLRPRSICEVGCGSGGILDLLSQEFEASVQFTGYDISEQVLALCRLREKKNLHFILGDVPEEGARFDLVLAIDVFEHVEDYMGFLRKLQSRGTHKIFRIPLNLSVQSVLCKSRPILRARESYGHLHYFTKETALATLEDSGYKITDSFHSFSPISTQALGWKRSLLKSMKKVLFTLDREWVARLLDGFSLMVLAE